MKEEISNNLNDAAQLEKLYRSNKVAFKREFGTLYPSIKDNKLADFWNERLNYENEKINWGTNKELFFVVVASLIAYLIARLPDIFSIDKEYFYPRNIGFIIFPLLTIYFGWKNKLSSGKIAFIVIAMLLGVFFINYLPNNKKSDTLILSCLHLLLFLWSLLGFAFTGEHKNNVEKRLGFLKYNGDLVVMTTLILIAGGIMTAITIGLFSLIGLNIEDFYFQNIGILGLAAAPIIGTYLTQTNPQLVGKVSPVIAKLFSPLVAVMLVIYLIAIVYSGKDPYNDREFLLVFNALLVGVMAIIFFSVAEIAKATKSFMQTWILFILSLVTIIVNCVALSAILFRISELGVTPNRIAVLGGNILILLNLFLVTAQLFMVLTKKTDITGVRKIIAFYLPFYFVWTIIVTFIFPLIFGFK
jgi:MFS family permease